MGENPWEKTGPVPLGSGPGNTQRLSRIRNIILTYDLGTDNDTIKAECRDRIRYTKNTLLKWLATQLAPQHRRKSRVGNPRFGTERVAQEHPIDEMRWLGNTQRTPTTDRRENVPVDDPRR